MIKEGQNIYDFAIQTYGTLENIFDVLDDNSLTFESELQSGMELNSDNFNKGDNDIKKLELTPVNATQGDIEFDFLSVFVESNEVVVDDTVDEGQSLYDISLQYFGTIEQVFEVLDQNGFNLNTLINSGQQLNISATNIGDQEIKDFYASNNIRPNNDVQYPTTGSQFDALLQWPEYVGKDIIILPNLIIL